MKFIILHYKQGGGKYVVLKGLLLVQFIFPFLYLPLF